MGDSKEPTFETGLTRLEEIVRKIEAGELPLEQSISLFEEGMKVAKTCQAKLDEAEKRIEKLTTDSDGNSATKAIDDPTESAPL